MPQPTKQEEFSKSLRALADWYDQHPNVPVPELKLSVNFKAEELQFIPASETRENIYMSPNKYGLYRRFLEQDGYEVQFYTGLDGVAERKVIGKKTEDIVEWVLKPSIAGTDSPQDAPEGNLEG